MANTNQAIKMIRKTKTRTQYNRWWKTNVKNAIKELLSKKSEKNPSTASLQKAIDKAIQKGVIHRSTGARIKSKAMKTLQSVKN